MLFVCAICKSTFKAVEAYNAHLSIHKNTKDATFQEFKPLKQCSFNVATVHLGTSNIKQDIIKHNYNH